jgi:hypothetical protein
MFCSRRERSAFRRFAPVRSASINAVTSLSIASTRWSMSAVCSPTRPTCSRERSSASASTRRASAWASSRIRRASSSASLSICAALCSAASTMARTCSDAAEASDAPLRRDAARWRASTWSASAARCSSTASGS